MGDLLPLEQAYQGNSQLAVELLALALEPLVAQLDKLPLERVSLAVENNLLKLEGHTFLIPQSAPKTSLDKS